jgi:hypothetical protein
LAVIDANTIGNAATPHFIVGLGGNENMIGGPGNDLFEAGGGIHTMTGGGGQNQFDILAGRLFVAVSTSVAPVDFLNRCAICVRQTRYIGDYGLAPVK